MSPSYSKGVHPASALDELCINTIRFLAVDAVQKARSGHPGMPLGAAAMTYTLWDRFLKFNPRDPSWPNRDRFVLSAGHGCIMLYALLHLYGFEVPLAEIKRFRQWGSITPGHPEYGKTPGVEATTGPLGQGFGNAVGLAIAETALAARFNHPRYPIVDHYTYVVAGDGDLMEGVSSEAASLAGHLKLGKLIVLYDDNHISIEGSTRLAFTEDVVARFSAYGWQVQRVEDSNDMGAVAEAIVAAQKEAQRPSLIAVRTHIGYGSPHKQDSAEAHGEPLGEQEVLLTKERLGWPLEPTFHIPAEALEHFRQAAPQRAARQAEWNILFEAYSRDYPDLAAEFQRRLQKELPPGWDQDLPVFSLEHGPLATRSASGKVLNAIAPRLPELVGGSADLAPSTKTLIDGGESFQADNRSGRNLHFGVREHAMGAILNGMAYHGGVVPYGATFLIFSDYMRPPMRLAAMGRLKVIYVFTHDGIGLGEDGPTHQAVEQLLGLRAIPNFLLLRPADANETAAAWQIALERQEGPVALVLTRQNLPVLDPAQYPHLLQGVLRGGYVLAEAPSGSSPYLVLVATGSEVSLALRAQETLIREGVAARVVSLPCWHLFQEQPETYRTQVLPPGVPVLVLETGVSLGWRSYFGAGSEIEVIGVDRFGASAPGEVVMQEYGFNADNVSQRALALLKRWKG
ncbi:MAG: transketolase [Thermodesulfobacteriota bacterium]